jgi:hypothetical protein
MISDKHYAQLIIFAIGTFILTVFLSCIIIPNIILITIDNSILVGPASAIFSAIVMAYIVFIRH